LCSQWPFTTATGDGSRVKITTEKQDVSVTEEKLAQVNESLSGAGDLLFPYSYPCKSGSLILTSPYYSLCIIKWESLWFRHGAL
jgi:hypothetical protein